MLALLAANKRYLSLYLLCASGGRYLAERCADRLPKASIGLSCLRFTRLASVDIQFFGRPPRSSLLCRGCGEGPGATRSGRVRCR